MGVLIYAQVILNLLPIRECKCCSKHKVGGVLCGTLIDCLDLQAGLRMYVLVARERHFVTGSLINQPNNSKVQEIYIDLCEMIHTE